VVCAGVQHEISKNQQRGAKAIRGSGQSLPGGCCVKETGCCFLQARARLRLSMRGRARCRPSNGVRWTGKAQEGTLKSDKRGTPGRMYGASSVSAMKPYSHVCKTITRLQSLASSGVGSRADDIGGLSQGCLCAWCRLHHQPLLIWACTSMCSHIGKSARRTAARAVPHCESHGRHSCSLQRSANMAMCSGAHP